MYFVLLFAALSSAAADQIDEPGSRRDDQRAAASIYGEVSLRDGKTLNGALRWEEEESLWLHHFNGRKLDPFDLDSLPSEIADPIRQSMPGQQLEINGHVIELNKLFGRQELERQSFAIEFGAIDQLKLLRNERVDVLLRDGTVLQADGGSNDIDSADIELIDSEGTLHELDWDDIDQIKFSSAPAEQPLFEPHLWGTARTKAGQFSGTISWDRDEAYPSQILDADMDGEEIEIAFSEIATLARDGKGTQVTTTDGNERWLTGTNDVDEGNRGLMIHVVDLGLVEIDWRDFESLRLEPMPAASLPDRTSWAATGPINGKLVHRNGNRLVGQLNFDFDQTHLAEHLAGEENNASLTIPWRLVATLATGSKPAEPLAVTLLDGTSRTLSGTGQIKRGNLGWLIGVDPVQHLSWGNFASASIEHPAWPRAKTAETAIEPDQ